MANKRKAKTGPGEESWPPSQATEPPDDAPEPKDARVSPSEAKAQELLHAATSPASETVHPSGAPEAGGATTHGSVFGGQGWWPSFLRAVARLSRAVEALAYRKLRDLDRSAREPEGARGRPYRVRGAPPPREHPRTV